MVDVDVYSQSDIEAVTNLGLGRYFQTINQTADIKHQLEEIVEYTAILAEPEPHQCVAFADGPSEQPENGGCYWCVLTCMTILVAIDKRETVFIAFCDGYVEVTAVSEVNTLLFHLYVL